MAKGNNIKLTQDRIRDLQCDGQKDREYMWDSTTPGLGVKVTRAGKKTFVYQYRIGQRTGRLTIGPCAMYTLSNAKTKAREYRRLVDNGDDPRKVKQVQIAKENASGKKLNDIFNDYVKAHEKQWSDRTMADTLYHSKKDSGVLWPLLQRRIEDINAKSLIKWANKATEAPAQRSNNQGRNSALAYGFRRFKAFWRWMYQDTEYKAVMANPDIFNNREFKNLIPANKAKNDALLKEQLPAWFEGVRQINSPEISAYLQILLLTGARRNELSQLQWKHVEFQWNRMWIKDKVEADGRVIPITPYVSYLLKELERRRDRRIEEAEKKGVAPKETKWVFFSPTSKSGHIEEPRIPHNRALAGTGITGITLHGLRRSFKSLSEWRLMPVGIVAQIMGHKPSATAEKHYTVRPVDLLAIWHTKFEKWILKQANVQFNAKAAEEGLQVVKTSF